MRIVILSAHPQDKNPDRWQRVLADTGAEVQILRDCPAELPPADFVVPHVLIADYRAQHPVWAAAMRYEAMGVPMLNSTASLARCADKWVNYLIWHDAGMPQPHTERLADMRAWPTRPTLVKPAYEECAHGVTVVSSLLDARAAAKNWMDQAIAQEIVPCQSVLRVHATATRVVAAASRPAAKIEGLPEPREGMYEIEISDELADLSTRAVAAVSGGLVGLDVIETAAGYVLLEANPPFSMPEEWPHYMRRLADAALADLA